MVGKKVDWKKEYDKLAADYYKTLEDNHRQWRLNQVLKKQIYELQKNDNKNIRQKTGSEN